MSYGDGKSLSALYDNRMRPTRWDVSTVLGYNYNYDTSRLGAISQRLRDSLYSAGATTEQVDKVNQTLFAISNDTHWLMIALMSLSIISFGSLFLLTRERSGKQNPPLVSENN